MNSNKPTDVDLDHIDKLHAAATVGEWKAVHVPAFFREEPWIYIEGGNADERWNLAADIDEQDAAFITSIKNAWPAVSREIRMLREEVALWRECAQYDASMEGPVFKGWNRSQMERCRKALEAGK